MIWDRGSRDEWNRMARVTGDSGWSWNSMQKYAMKVTTIDLL
jgi:choline dehydrogenase